MDPTWCDPLRAVTAAEQNRLATARRDGPFVAWRDDSGELCVHGLEPDQPVPIGREGDSAVVLGHPLVSRDHAVVLLRRRRSEDASVYVVDAGSRHGTEYRPIAVARGAVTPSGRFASVPSQPARPLRLAAGDYDVRLAGEVWFQIGGVPLDVGATRDKEDQLAAPTQRERDVLVELCRPQFHSPDRRVGTPSNAQIGGALTPAIGAERVSDLLSQLYVKYGLAGTKEQNRSELVELALRHRLVSHEHFG
jgi:FHA domain